MRCEEFALLLDRLPDTLAAEENEAMRAHRQTCADCALAYALRADMRAMDGDEAVPASFGASWRRAIREEDESMTQRKKGFGWMRALAVAAAAVFVVGGAILAQNGGWGLNKRADSAGAAQNNSAEYSKGYEPGSAAPGGNGLLRSADYGGMASDADGISYAETQDAAGDSAAQAQKIIRTVDITLKTRDYEADYAALLQWTKDCGGSVESLSVSGDGSADALRRAYLTLRIPSEKLDVFTGGAKSVGTMAAYSETSEDVSASYYDVQTRLEAQKAKMTRLLALMEQAQNMADLIEIESAVSDTQYMIDTYTGRLNNYDSRVNDSYVSVTLRELSPQDAADEKEYTLWERMKNALEASLADAAGFLQGAAVFLIAALPWLAGLGALIALGAGLRRIVRRGRDKKRAE